MFAVLGEIFFEVLTSPQTFRAASEYHFAEHKVVEASPRLQWMAQELEKITLGLGFHVAFTNPATQMNLLYAAAQAHQANPLVFGNGIFRGYFVIESIEETFQQTADDGSYIALEAKVELKQYAPGADFDPLAPPRQTNPPPGVVSSPAGAATGPYDPLAAISASNLLPLSAITVLSSVGAPAGVTYAAADYVAAGVSALAGIGQPGISIAGAISDVPVSSIVRAG
jgi:phage protein U